MADRIIFSSIGNRFGDSLEHIGTKYHSGRYEYGSGENPYQHDPHAAFYYEYRQLLDEGKTPSQIADYFDKTYYGGEGKFKSTQLRAKISLGHDAYIAAQRSRLLYLTNERQMSVNAASKAMGISESTARSFLKEDKKVKINSTRNLADRLADDVKAVKYLDVGEAVNLQYGVSKTKLDTAIAMLEDEGYKKHYIPVQNATNKDFKTTMQILVKDDTPYKEIIENIDKVQMNPMYQPEIKEDGEWTAKKIPSPKSISSDRISIRYAEDGGIDKDGVIEIRPGVADLDLGENSYAQVRIVVDDDHYLKGMAIYSNDIPKGKDIIFNTNKSSDTPMINPDGDKDHQVLKNLKEGESQSNLLSVKRVRFNDDGEQTAINIVNEDEDWDTWSKNLASQFLSKQDPTLIKQQLNVTYNNALNEYEEISSLTNPTVKKKLLMDFADQCESDACTLKAAPLPRQATKVILPVTSLKDNEVYAPQYNNGEEVVLVRYPHGGLFEIPRLKVNNNNKEGKSVMGLAENAIGINTKTAQQLSGADFDGDTVIIIPTTGQKIKNKDYYTDLQDYEPKIKYKAYDGMTRVGEGDGFVTNREMGKITNLITDMTMGGAVDSEIVRAVKHSMTVIDAEKHNLNWKQSYEDNGIAELKEKYQGGKTKGASTLLSRSTSQESVPARKELVSPSSMTEEEKERYYSGKKVYRNTNETYLTLKNKSGLTGEEKKIFKKLEKKEQSEGLTSEEEKTYQNLKDKKDLPPEQKQAFYEAKKAYNASVKAKRKEAKDNGTEFDGMGDIPADTNGLKFKVEYKSSNSKKMLERDDARELIGEGDTTVENLYANHANKLKSLAQEARKEAIATSDIEYNPSAAKAYASEVESLKNSLKKSQLNKPLEREAQRIASKKIAAKKAANPGMDEDDIKKMSNKEINKAREQTGAKRYDIKITDKEWEAIQAGAIHKTTLRNILDKADTETVRKLATPKTKKGMTTSQVSRAKALLKKGYTQAEVAEFLGVSTSTISNNINVNAINKERRENANSKS